MPKQSDERQGQVPREEWSDPFAIAEDATACPQAGSEPKADYPEAGIEQSSEESAPFSCDEAACRDAMEKVPERIREELLDFVETGEASDEFLAEFEGDAELQDVVKVLFAARISRMQDALKSLRGIGEEEQGLEDGDEDIDEKIREAPDTRSGVQRMMENPGCLEALALVPVRIREQMCEFVLTGEGTPEFIAELESDPELQTALEELFCIRVTALQDALRPLRGEE